MNYATHADIEAHERLHGHPASALPMPIREAYIKEGMAIPERHVSLTLHTPPPPGNCHVCGIACDPAASLRQCAVAGFEEAKGADSELLRFVVSHCPEHADARHLACLRNEVDPATGIKDAVGGFCEPITSEISLGISLFPGAEHLGKFLKYAFLSMGLVLPMLGAILTSAGQQSADMQGGNNSIGAGTGDATSGHGYNAGNIKVYKTVTTAPTTANAAEEASSNLINWVLPATAFAAPTGTIPNLTMTMNAVTNVAAILTGTATYARLLANGDDGLLSTSERRIQLQVGTSGSDMNFNTLSIVNAGTCSMTSLVVTHGA